MNLQKHWALELNIGAHPKGHSKGHPKGHPKVHPKGKISTNNFLNHEVC